MKIILGLDLDGPVYRPVTAEAGTCVCGSLGILGRLDTMLGLGMHGALNGRRLIVWNEALKAADNGKRFYSKSFQADRWGTGRRLLEIRDQLLIHAPSTFNLQSFSKSDGRIEDFSCAEKEFVKAGLIPGQPEQLRGAIAVLKTGEIPCPILKIHFTDNRDWWPLLWKELFNELEKRGVAFSNESMPAKPLCKAGDLGATQARLLNSGLKPVEAKGDGSIVQVAAAGCFEAADLSALLCRNLAKAGESVVVIAQTRQAELNAAFNRIDAPSSRYSEQYPGGDLGMFVQTSLLLWWKPADARSMIEYLDMKPSPVPLKLRLELLEIAGRGATSGDKWDKTIDGYRKEMAGKGEKELKDFESKLDLWIRPNCLRSDASIPVVEIEKRCLAFEKWTHGVSSSKEISGPFLDSIQAGRTAAMQLKDLCAAYGSHIDRVAFEQIAVEVASSVSTMQGGPRLKGGPGLAGNPASVLAEADTVIWWDASDETVMRPDTPFWSVKEEEQLGKEGVVFPDPVAMRRNEAELWNRAALLCRKRFFMVRGALKNEDSGLASQPHPFWHQCASAFVKSERGKLIPDPEKLIRGEIMPELFSGTKTHKTVSPPMEHKIWKLKSGLLESPDSIYASGLPNICKCPLKFVLENHASLEDSLASVEVGPLLLGTIAHDVIEGFFVEKCIGSWPAVDYREELAGYFDKWIKEHSLLVDIAGFETDRYNLRYLASTVGAYLAEKSKAAGYVFVETEKKIPAIEKPFGVSGRIDLLFEQKKDPQKKLIVDIKWSDSEGKRTNELKNGTAAQLSAYSMAMGKGKIPTAYLIIRGCSLLTVHPELFPDIRPIDGPDEKATWDGVTSKITGILTNSEKGTVEHGDVNDGLYPAECEYCSFGTFCTNPEQE